MKNKVEVLDMIAKDMKDDAKNFDGKPITGKTIGKYFGCLGAAITALAEILKLYIEENK